MKSGVIETCQHLNGNKYSCWSFFGFGPAFTSVCAARPGLQLFYKRVCIVCSRFHASTRHFLVISSSSGDDVKESECCHQNET